MLPKLLKGRLNRKNYFLPIFYAFLVGFFFGVLSGAFPESESVFDWIITLTLGLLAVVAIPLQVRRAHDIGWSGMWVIIFTILYALMELIAPFITVTPIWSTVSVFIIAMNIFATLFLVFMAGDEGANQFGEPDTLNYLKNFNLKAVILNERP